MFNLLPENLKNQIISEYKLRRYTIILIFILAVQASFLIFLFPSWLISVSKEREIISQYEQMNKFLLESEGDPDANLVKNLNKKLSAINTTLEYPKILFYIDTIISKKTSSITIDQFSYAIKDSTSANMSIGGKSVTRDALVAFVKALEEAKVFKKVDLPIGNLAKDRDINFSINVTIAPLN